jgi:glycosyltransferase involved in cell wall biosynthesis
MVPAVPPNEVAMFHQLADALVTTRARGTNTPLKLYQYLRAGRPIIATEIRSHTQVLDVTVAELVAPDAASIAAGLIRVLGDPEHAARLSTSAARLAQERYSEEIYLTRLEKLLAQLPRARRDRDVSAGAGPGTR